MGSTARSPRVRARVTPHKGQGESLVPLYTRESVSLSHSYDVFLLASSQQASTESRGTPVSMRRPLLAAVGRCSLPYQTRVESAPGYELSA
jgi:hypothetical protein